MALAVSLTIGLIFQLNRLVLQHRAVISFLCSL